MNKTWSIRAVGGCSATREGRTDTCCNMAVPQTREVEGKKPITEDHVPYEPIYTKCPECQQLCSDRKMNRWPRAGKGLEEKE